MGQILTKKGMGGHGMQAYDEESGEYVDVTLKVGDKTVSTFGEYLDLMKERHPEDAEAIKSEDPEVIGKYSEKFSSAFEKKVAIMNKSRYSTFKDAKDLEEHFDRLFTPVFVDTLKELCPEGVSKYTRITPVKEAYMDSVTIAIFRGRFGRAKMRPMDEETFKLEYNSDKVDRTLTTQRYQNYGKWDAASTAEFLRNLPKGKSVPFFRGVHHVYGRENKDIVARGFYDEKSPVLTNISAGLKGAGNGIYTMPSIDVIYARIDYGGKGYIKGQSGIVIVHGLIDNVSDLRITSSKNWDYGASSREVRELMRRAEDKEFGLKMADSLFAKGFGDIHQCRSMAKNISNAISNDYGTAAAVLGYDIMTGYGHEMVVLNPNCARVSTTYNED